MAVIHRGLQQGRSVLGLVIFHQLQLPVLRPSKRSCLEKRVFGLLMRDIPRTVWSSRPDTVFLLES